jgi:hypothetical protein
MQQPPLTLALTVAATALVAACATARVETVASPVSGWEGREIAALTAAIGPFDKYTVKGESGAYEWFRFGRCHLTARTGSDGKITAVETQGTREGCKPYLDKMGAT